MPQILVVDDEPEIASIIQAVLEERGFVVKAAVTDAEALAVLEVEAAETSVLVTDINLGRGVTGFDIARKARSMNPGVKVVYITGQAAHLERFGVDDALLLEKPFHPSEFADTLVSLVAQRAHGPSSPSG